LLKKDIEIAGLETRSYNSSFFHYGFYCAVKLSGMFYGIIMLVYLDAHNRDKNARFSRIERFAD